jgi:type I restriction enzyme S subunit
MHTTPGQGVPPGYKQTEVGVIPEDWSVVPIGSLLVDFKGGAPFRPSDFTNSGVTVLPKSGVGKSGWLSIRSKDIQFCSSDYATAFARSQVDETYTIVVLRDLVPSGPSIGLMVNIKEKERYILAQGVYGLKFSSLACSRYLVQLSNTPWYRGLANSIMVGSTQVHIANSAFKSAEIPLPNTKEQEAIAEALSDADALIESLEQLLAKKREVKQGAMQELLTGAMRISGFSKDWEEKPLADVIGSLEAGVSVNAVDTGMSDFQSEKCILKTSAVVDGRFIPSESKQIVPKDLDRAKVNPQKDTIIISRMNTPDLVGECGYVAEDYPNLFVPDRLWMTKFRSGVEINTRWLSYVLSTKKYKTTIRSAATGTSGSMKNLSKGALLSMIVKFPEPAEQAAIAAVIVDMDDAITELETKLTKARQIKQAMMQELLTGRIRLM